MVVYIVENALKAKIHCTSFHIASPQQAPNINDKSATSL